MIADIKKKLYKKFPALPNFNLSVGRKLHAVNLSLNKKNVIKGLVGKKSILANVGCGGSGLATNWVNIDYVQYENVHHAYDCRRDVPFASSSVRALYTEHFFEHLDYISEVPYFLQDCFRSLEPSGIIRIVVPDAEKYLRAYCTNDWAELTKVVPLDDNHTDLLMNINYSTKMEAVNEIFRQSGQHKFAWDFDTMKVCLERAGFTEVEKMGFNKSNLKELEIDQEIRSCQSLYVEAKKS